jgi:hypothetical protein
MLPRLVLLAVLSCPVVAHAATAPAVDGGALIREFRHWTGDRPDTPDDFAQQLLRWNASGAGFDALVAHTAREYAMDAGLAREVVVLALRGGDARTAAREGKDLRARRQRLLDAHPGEWLLLAEVARDADDDDQCDATRLEGLVARWPDHDLARMRLSRVVPCLELLGPRTAAEGAGAEPFVALAEMSMRVEGSLPGNELLRTALLDVARRRVDAEPGFDPARSAALRALQVRNDIGLERLDPVVAAASAHEAEILEQLDADTRLDVAGALAQAGQLDAARRWRGYADARRGPSPPLPECPPRPPGEDRPTTCERSNEDAVQAREYLRQKLELLAWSLGERQGDAFAVLTQSDADFMSPLDKGPWLAVRSRVAVDAGYPKMASPDPGWGSYFDEQDLEGARTMCFQCAPEIVRELEAIVAQVAARPKVPRPTLPDDRPAALLARMDALIDADAIHWRESPLPANAMSPPADPTPCDDCEPPPAPAWASRLPAGRLVRWEQSGHRIVAVTASQSLDPVGEVSAGGYWLSESLDGGAHFATPLYTGLRVQQPYVVRPVSKLAMLAGDTVRLEVSVREVDAARVRFPPVGDLPLKRQADDRYVEIALEKLRHDGDDDGLADPVEVAMLLDPGDADTDDDGITDGADMLPNVPWRAGDEHADARAAALGAVLDVVAKGSFGAAITHDPHATTVPTDPLAIDGGTDAHNELGVTFLHVDPADLAPLTLRQPVVVVSGAQLERLQQRRGAFYALEVGVTLNHAGTEGVGYWSTRWSGGTVLLYLREGRWVVEPGMQWISGVDRGRGTLAMAMR